MEVDEEFMIIAIKEGERCISVTTAFNVGAVIVDDQNQIVSKGFSRELEGNTHAEECALLKLAKFKNNINDSDSESFLTSSDSSSSPSPSNSPSNSGHVDPIASETISKLLRTHQSSNINVQDYFDNSKDCDRKEEELEERENSQVVRDNKNNGSKTKQSYVHQQQHYHHHHHHHHDHQIVPCFDGVAEGMTIYTTMEPCTHRLSGKECCVSLLLKSKIKRVVVGVKEPDYFVKCQGIDALKQNGIIVDFVSHQTQQKCIKLNSHLLSS